MFNLPVCQTTCWFSHGFPCGFTYGKRNPISKCESMETFWGIQISYFKFKLNNKRWWGCGAIGTLIYCWWGCKVIWPVWKAFWQFLTKLNIFLPYDATIILLGIHPNELKTYVHTKTCTWMFIAALFIIAHTWKQPRCPSVGE